MPPARTEEEIARLAEHIIGGRVYSVDEVAQSQPRLVPMVFLPLGLGGLNGYRREQLSRLFAFAIFGEDKTSGQAINGWPIFFSMQIWRRQDAVKAYKKANEAREVLRKP